MRMYMLYLLHIQFMFIAIVSKKPFDSGTYYVYPRTGQNLAFSFRDGKLTLDYKGSEVSFIVTTEDEKKTESEESSSSDSTSESSSEEDVCQEKKSVKKVEQMCLQECKAKSISSQVSKQPSKDYSKCTNQTYNTCEIDNSSKHLSNNRKLNKKEELLSSINKALLIGSDAESTLIDPTQVNKKNEAPLVSAISKLCTLPKNISSSFNVSTGYCPSNIASTDITNLSAIKYNQLDSYFPTEKVQDKKDEEKKPEKKKVKLVEPEDNKNLLRLDEISKKEESCCTSVLDTNKNGSLTKKRKIEPFSITYDSSLEKNDASNIKTKLKYLKKQMNNKFLKENVKTKFPKLYNSLIDYKYGLSVGGNKICKQDADIVQCRGDYVSFRVVKRQTEFMIKLVENNDITKFYLEMCITRENEFDLKLRKCNTNNPYQMFSIKKKKKDCDIYKKEADENTIYHIKVPETMGITEPAQQFKVEQATEIISLPTRKPLDVCAMQKASASSESLQCADLKGNESAGVNSVQKKLENPLSNPGDCQILENNKPPGLYKDSCIKNETTRPYTIIENGKQDNCNPLAACKNAQPSLANKNFKDDCTNGNCMDNKENKTLNQNCSKSLICAPVNKQVVLPKPNINFAMSPSEVAGTSKLMKSSFGLAYQPHNIQLVDKRVFDLSKEPYPNRIQSNINKIGSRSNNSTISSSCWSSLPYNKGIQVPMYGNQFVKENKACLWVNENSNVNEAYSLGNMNRSMNITKITNNNKIDVKGLLTKNVSNTLMLSPTTCPLGNICNLNQNQFNNGIGQVRTQIPFINSNKTTIPNTSVNRTLQDKFSPADPQILIPKLIHQNGFFDNTNSNCLSTAECGKRESYRPEPPRESCKSNQECIQANNNIINSSHWGSSIEPNSKIDDRKLQSNKNFTNFHLDQMRFCQNRCSDQYRHH